MNPTIIDIPGIGPAAVETLAEHRIRTVRALARASVQKIASIPGFSEARAAKVKEAAAALLADQGTAAGSENILEEPREKDKEKRGKKGKKDKKKDKGKKQKKHKKDRKKNKK